MAAPRVSVVMPVHNEERFVEQAIGSVLAQTFHDLELIVVDDGSSDASAEILQRLAREDRRVRVVRQERSGLVQALNRGCALGDGALIARMDADDVSYPERLRRQVEQLERRPALGVIGSWVRYVDAAGAPIGEWRTPVGPSLVSWALLFGTQLAHPSVVMRRRLFERVGGYPTSSPHAEDYDLWLRAVHHAELDNVPEFLLDRRVHGEQRLGSARGRAGAVRARAPCPSGARVGRRAARRGWRRHAAVGDGGDRRRSGDRAGSRDCRATPLRLQAPARRGKRLAWCAA